MAIEVQAPEDFSQYLNDNYITLFAGGSIEMDKAKPWQKRLVRLFNSHDNVVILNPRRNGWDSSWKQSINNRNFRTQVQWELSGLEESDAAVMYFDPATKSPISLLELGLTVCSGIHMHVICPRGFWRKGNVDIVCTRYKIPMFTSLTAATNHIKKNLDKYRRVEYR
jgi:hypothetical protein